MDAAEEMKSTTDAIAEAWSAVRDLHLPYKCAQLELSSCVKYWQRNMVFVGRFIDNKTHPF